MEQQDVKRLDLSGGLNFGSVTLVHVADHRSWFKLGALLLLVWFAASLGIELFKFLLNR